MNKWQRLGATLIGLALAAGGVVSVFLGKSGAGSVALVLGGVTFLIIAVIGLSLHRVRIRDVELYFGVRRARQVGAMAGRLPPGDAARLVQMLTETNDGDDQRDRLLVLADWLLFEIRVRDTTIASLADGERVIPHPVGIGTGEPLLKVLRPDGTRIGIFAMFSPTDTGRLTEAFDDEFLDVLPRTGTDAVILITCVRDEGYLAALSDRIRRETGLPTAIDEWRPRGESRSLRPSIERLSEAVRAGGGDPPQVPPPSRGRLSTPPQSG
ncbi:hypothetical protein WN71_003820 [Streptomyces mangrovisoli]|uniref:Uncharacterized protein n=1 Tax=Streptomyces mangrovisoli TaxID=1428628 RepID=A0A1J4P614_9ACTN|nr:hypothetical protein WN71_003820 [Streptomyces mangrovisoli]